MRAHAQPYLCPKEALMENTALNLIARELNIRYQQVATTSEMLEGGATLPFIARYRKEQTGGLDETQIANLQEKLAKYKEVSKRRESILHTLDEQGNLTAELKKQLEETWDLQTLEDLYLPYKPKKQTRAEKARKAGLEPLAQLVWKQIDGSLKEKAKGFLS